MFIHTNSIKTENFHEDMLSLQHQGSFKPTFPLNTGTDQPAGIYRLAKLKSIAT